MENEQNVSNVNNVEEPKPGSGFGANSLQVPIDTGDGLSCGPDSAYGKVSPEDQDFNTFGPTDRETLSFTQMGSAFITPATKDAYSDVDPTIRTGYDSYGETTPFGMCFNRRQARPTMCARGTNHLVPFGAHTFIQYMGGTTITTKGALSSVTSQMNALTPGIVNPGSYREVANWKRVFELKNVIISYFNRNIPFTELEASDRFAIEMCYSRDLLIAAMPLIAKATAMSLVRHEQRTGYQYATENLINLNSLTCERICKQIYAAIAELPVLDKVLMKRATEMSKLHLTAKNNGFTPTILMQDWTPAGPGRYQLANYGIDPQNGYVITTNLKGIIDNPTALNGTTFMEWLEIWLRADLYSEQDVANVLNNFLHIAQSIRTNYSIMLGCAMQLELKGAISYDSASAYLPVSGISDFALDYKLHEPSFSYTYKERFEYAPRKVSYERAGGSAGTDTFCLARFTTGSDESTFARPVGLYKGSKAWGTKEVIGIGVFKSSSLSASTNLYSLKQLFNDALATPLTVTSTDIGADIAILWEDAYYGDVYSTGLSHVVKVNTTDTAVTYYNTVSELVSFYGLYRNSPTAAPFATLSTWEAAAGSTPTSPMTIYEGSMIMNYSGADFSGGNGEDAIMLRHIAAILVQLDLSFFASTVYNAGGKIQTPLIIWNPYRGCEWDRFDMTPVENACADSYRILSIDVRMKSQNSAR